MARGARNNPYSPGAGAPPPALTGREREIEHFQTLLARLGAGAHEKSMIVTGQRGVGKTVLLNRFESLADEAEWFSDFYEVPRDAELPAALARMARRALLRISRKERMRSRVDNALGVLKAFTVTVGGIELNIDVDAARGSADSGDLAEDLRDLLIEVGRVAQQAGTGVLFLFDEVQFVRKAHYEALVIALHRLSQKRVPLAVVGAGLPLLPRLTGEAKSYSERMFDYSSIGRLSPEDAEEALRRPARERGVEYAHDALARLMDLTGRYPYFIQEYGKHVWNVASTDTITLDDVEAAVPVVRAYLDEGFFEVRMGRTTKSQRRYMVAMADLGDGPQSSSAVAERLGIPDKSASPTRAELIDAALIYVPQRGSVDFTVPGCADYVRRRFLDIDE
jgi:AAA ATPase domain